MLLLEEFDYTVEYKPKMMHLQANHLSKELDELDERRRVAAQNIEAIQRRRKKTFDKRNKKRDFEPGMLVMIRDARKLDFSGKFDALWMGPYVVQAVFSNNSLQLETLNGESFPWRTSGSRCKQFRA